MAARRAQGNAGGGGVGEDLYAVLGLKKECSPSDLRSAYKKLAMRWHPDRCSSPGSSKSMEEAKAKFQDIQAAYSVLSDTSKRFLYDVGVYDSDDDANGMGEFLGEMAAMMSQAKPNEVGKETFEELQELFVEMFQADMDAFCGGGGGSGGGNAAAAAPSWAQRSTNGCDRPSTSSTGFFPTNTATSFYGGGRAAAGGGHKRDSAEMCSGKAKAVASPELGSGGSFCFGQMQAHDGNGSAARGREGSGCGKRRNGRKTKASSRHGLPSQDGEAPAE